MEDGAQGESNGQGDTDDVRTSGIESGLAPAQAQSRACEPSQAAAHALATQARSVVAAARGRSEAQVAV